MLLDNDRTLDPNQSTDLSLNANLTPTEDSPTAADFKNSGDSIDNNSNELKGNFKDNNPFRGNNYREQNRKTYSKSAIPNSELIKYPFKTSNRILDDIKWTIPYKSQYGKSLLNNKSINYSKELSNIVNRRLVEYDLITLNNNLNYSPSIETIELEDRNQKLTIIRGLLVNFNEVNHFRLMVLDNNINPFITNIVDKYEYHIIPKSLISIDDLNSLRVFNEELIDDAFFNSSNGPTNQILRVSIFKQEFTHDVLYPLINQDIIKQRYLEGVEKHPNLNLSVDVIPNITHCFKTLIRALRGPVLLKEDESMKTISLNDTVLDSQVDIDLLLNKLGFTLNESGDELIPPNLSSLPVLKESYIRRIQELIYLGRIYGKSINPNDFLVNYSYSDNLSLIFRTFNEFDKHICQTYFRNHNSSQLPFLINLNICTFFQDELIIKCFENTVKSDPVNKLYYVDSLKNTLNFRNSSSSNNKLKSYYQNLSSRGELIGFNDYINSLKNIGIILDDTNNVENVDDDIIIAMYQNSYKNDPKNYQYYNNNLQTIIKVRNSKKLTEFFNIGLLPLNIAMDELSIEEITEDEVVITAYEFKLDDILQSNGFKTNDNEVIMLHKSLLSVAVNRKSYLLLNYIENKLPQFIGTSFNLTFEQACEKVNCNVNSSDFEIISNFQKKIMEEGSEDIRILRYCLKVVAENKKSEILFSFLKTGKVDSSILPTEDWPAGLDNIGNTCYLNSLLQYYFCIKPLREMVLSFNEKNINPVNQQNRKIGGRKVEDLEIKRSNQFIYHLRNLFNEMIHTDKRCVQPSKDLAYLSFLPLSQSVTFKENDDPEIIEVLDGSNDANPILITSQTPTPSIHNSNYNLDDVEMRDEHQVNEELTISSELTCSSDLIEEIPAHVELKNPSDVHNNESDEPKILPISTDQMESTIEVGRQQDVTECMENVTFQIETALEPESLENNGEQYDLIKRLFYGKTKQTIAPLDTDNKPRVSIERFFSLIINVGDHPKDIYDSLDNYFNEDLVKLEEGLVKKSLTICQLPEVLQFHVQRVLFDREILMPYKSLEPIPFSEKIYLDRYLDTNDQEILNKRNEVFKWKSEIKELNKTKDEILQVDNDNKLSVIDSLITTKKYLESRILNHDKLSINPSTILAIQQQIDKLKHELQLINNRLNQLQNKVSHQFDSYTKVGYSIFAIFIHRGEASYGHYWLYIKDPHKNIFRKYNDETVSEVPASEVFNFTEGNTATPYYIVYVKDTLKREYIEPLKRIVNKC